MRGKKVISLILCFILLFTIVVPAKKTEAFAPAFAIPLSAIPASVKISAGAMALGGTIVAGIVTGLALGSIDFDIVGKAQEIWDGFSSSLKSAWENLFDSHWEANSNVIRIDQSLKSSLVNDLPDAFLFGSAGIGFGEAVRTVYNHGRGLRFEFENDDYYFLARLDKNFGVYKTLDIRNPSSSRADFVVSERVQYRGSHGVSGYLRGVNDSNWDDIRDNIMINVRAALGFINIHKDLNTTYSLISASALEEFNRMRVDMYSSAFPLASANEIYYPLESIYPYAESLGKDHPLEWNADIDAFVLPQNPSVPYNGNVGWYIPAPTAYLDNAGSVRVGFRSADGTITDALTGQVVDSGAGVQPIPGEGVDVPAGFFDTVLQGLGSLVSGVSSLVDLFTNGLIGDVGAIRWDKIMNLGYDLTNKFPFSIPWDVGRAFNAVFGGISVVDVPVWDFEVNFLGNRYSFSISFPEYVLNWFPVIRTFILVLFDVGIVLSIRQWLGGAS